MIGPDKEEFLELYELADGNRHEFNESCKVRNLETLSERTFQRRVAQWVRDGKPYEPAQKDEQEDLRPVAGGTIEPPDRRRGKLQGKRFVFTAAQNNTFVHEDFWENLLKFCDYNDAQLVVGKFRYNKSGFQNATKDSDDLWFDSKILPYVVDESMKIDESNNGTVWCGELDILPTAVNPMSGLDSYTHTANSIIPHAKVQLKSVPVLKGQPGKMLYSTGACTQRNYIQRKAGQKAEFHHVFGALFVEIDEDGTEFVRQLIADSTGSFYDLTTLFTNGEVREGQRVEAINWGDIHAEMLDHSVEYASWKSPESMLDELMPRYQFVHDLTDFKARNHHNIRNPHFLAEMHFEATGNVEYGMEQAAASLEDLEREWCQTVVVESNHDQAFRRWLSEADIRTDPENAEYFHRSNAELFKEIREGNPRFHIFEWAVREFADLSNTIFLDEDDSFVICGENGIECGMHGHRGPNGARGNPNALRNLGRKCNVGHTHSAAILDGIYVAGLSCKMDMGYNKGPSSWSHSHIVTYPNGKRTIITMKNGKWRA
jgi:hypothetical protein